MIIYHVHVKKTGNDYYYVSVATIFENMNLVNTTYHRLRSYFAKHKTDRFEDGRCVIKRGMLISKVKDGRKKKRPREIKGLQNIR